MSIFFLRELTLILRVDQKRENRARDICKGTLDIEFERDLSVGFSSTLDEVQKVFEKINFFYFSHVNYP